MNSSSKNSTKAPARTPPDLTVVVRQKTRDGNAILTYELRSNYALPDYAYNLEEMPLGPDPFSYFKEFFEDIESLRLTPEEARVNILNTSGINLTRKILPPKLCNTLWFLKKQGKLPGNNRKATNDEENEEAVRTVQVDTDEPWIPWEMMKVLKVNLENNDTEAVGDFLCEAFALTRWLRGFPPCQRFSLSHLRLMVMTRHDLRAVEGEYNDIKDLFEKFGRAVEPLVNPTLDQAMHCLENCDSTIIDSWHFAGHGVNRATNPDFWTIPLSDAELTPARLPRQALTFSRGGRPLVFLNACHTARSAQSLGYIGGWAVEFFRLGTGAFIGASWETRDDLAREFAHSFYRSFIGGMSIAEAVRKARLEVKRSDPGDPTWLAYTVFAHPYAQCSREEDEATPEEPYPLILPYVEAYSGLFAGRSREIEDLHAQISGGQPPILGLFAPSGTGKSSLLAAGLVPKLRAENRPVALVRWPRGDGLEERLIRELKGANHNLARYLAERRQVGDPPVIILDEVERILHADHREDRDVVHKLLVETVRCPERPLCYWILAYRQEAHGRICVWLRGVLAESDDLAGAGYFHWWVLPPFGTPYLGSGGARGETRRAFEEAITKPFEVGDAVYPWFFAEGEAERLAEAFSLRRESSAAPLVTELQIVLGNLLAVAKTTGSYEIVVPANLDGLGIDTALQDYMESALGIGSKESRDQNCDRTLSVLVELATDSYRNGDGISSRQLKSKFGEDIDRVIDELIDQRVCLVLKHEANRNSRYTLSQHRFADVILQAFPHRVHVKKASAWKLAGAVLLSLLIGAGVIPLATRIYPYFQEPPPSDALLLGERVSIREYRKFLEEDDRLIPEWLKTVENVHLDEPMSRVGFVEAKQFCEQYGWRLPEEEEWRRYVKDVDSSSRLLEWTSTPLVKPDGTVSKSEVYLCTAADRGSDEPCREGQYTSVPGNKIGFRCKKSP